MPSIKSLTYHQKRVLGQLSYTATGLVLDEQDRRHAIKLVQRGWVEFKQEGPQRRYFATTKGRDVWNEFAKPKLDKSKSNR